MNCTSPDRKKPIYPTIKSFTDKGIPPTAVYQELHRLKQLKLLHAHTIPGYRIKEYRLARPVEQTRNRLVEYLAGRWPPKRKTLHKIRDGRGKQVNAHNIMFRMDIQKLPQVDSLPYDPDKTRVINNAVMQYAEIRIAQVIEIPDYVISIQNCNNKTIVARFQAIDFEFDKKEKVENLDKIIDSLKWTVWRILENYYGFKLSEPKAVTKPHWAIPEPSLVGELESGTFKQDEDSHIDFSPRQYDDDGKPIPQLEATTKEKRDSILSVDMRVGHLEKNLSKLREDVDSGFLSVTDFLWELKTELPIQLKAIVKEAIREEFTYKPEKKKDDRGYL